MYVCHTKGKIKWQTPENKDRLHSRMGKKENLPQEALLRRKACKEEWSSGNLKKRVNLLTFLEI